MKNRTGQLLLHFTGCIAFLSLPVLLSPDVSQTLHFIRLAPFQQDFLSYALILLFFYLNYFRLLPRLYFRKKYLPYFLWVLSGYLVVALLPGWLVPGNHMPALPPPEFVKSLKPPRMLPGPFILIPLIGHLFQFTIVIILSALIQINNRLRQTEKEKVNAELLYLKAQINPHFLFNTLNCIYSSAIEENADHTANAVVKLSGMMRYVITEAHNDFVSLEKELDYIGDYIELQKIRLAETVRIGFHISGSGAGKKIAPLLLISFIENAFKHGVNPEAACAISVEITIQGYHLQLLVSNAKVATMQPEGSNIGIENTQGRLQLLYPSKHELQITEDEKDFVVLLKIDLQ
jgi:Histidine kinase